MKELRKALVVGVMSVTVFSMSMLAVPMQADAASAGDLIKMDGLSSVYYLAADGKRYVFPNETTYFSWYRDFSGVVTIPQSELETYPLGANVTMRPGTKLVKITTDPKVYAVEPDGMLLHVPDEATAEALWGENWADRVVDVPDAFFTNYTVSSEQVSDDAYPTGSLIKTADDATIYYISSDGTARPINDEAAFFGNRFSFGDVITTDLEIPTEGDPITGAIADITDTSSGAGGSAGAGTGLSVSIASDTPEAGNIPAGSPVDFLKFNLTASNDGDVKVISITLNGYDLGDSTNIDNVTLYVDGAKLVSSKNVSSDRKATFNLSNPLVVEAGTTETVRVRATIAAGSAGNYALGIASASSFITDGAAVSGSFPIIGNTKAIVSGTNIGTITMSSVTGDLTATAEFGEDDVLLAGFSLAAANEAVLWESAMFRNFGTNDDNIVDNLRLEIDGDIVAEGASLSNKYVTFDLDNYLIDKNETIVVEVYGDIGIANENNTINLLLDAASDFMLTGQQYGFGILISDISSFDTANTDGIKVTLEAGDFTIDMDKSATPADDVRVGATDLVLATINMTSNGENATTDGIVGTNANEEFIISGTGLECNEFDNAELRDTSTGALYDLTIGSSTITAGTCYLSTTEEISFVKGVTKTFQLRVDLQGTNDDYPIDNGDTLQVTLKGDAFTLTGDDSSASITNITPSEVSGAIMTVKTASVTFTTTALTNKTVVPGASDVIVYQGNAKVGASSDVTLYSFQLDAKALGSFGDSDITKLDLYVNGELAKSASNKISGDNTAAAYIKFSSLLSGKGVMPAGTNVPIVVKADFASSFSTSSAFILRIESATDSIVVKDDKGNTFAENATAALNVDSRQITLQSKGTLKVELKTDDQKADDDTYILAGAETTADRYLGELVFTTANEPIKIESLVLSQAGDATDSDILVVNLYDEDGEIVAYEGVTPTGDVDFDTLNLELPADQATSYFIGVITKGINVDGDPASTASHDNDISFTLGNPTDLGTLGYSADQAVVAKGVNSGETIDMAEATSATVATGQYANWGYATSTTATIHGSVLTSIVNAMSDGVLTGGTSKTLGKYTFVFDNGSNRNDDNEALKAQLVNLVINVATSSVGVSSLQLYVEGDPTKLATSTASADGTEWTFNANQLQDNLSNSALVDGSVTLVIKGTVSSPGTNAYVQTEIDNLSGSGDFSYDGNHGTDSSDTSDVRLDLVEVIGATLSN